MPFPWPVLRLVPPSFVGRYLLPSTLLTILTVTGGQVQVAARDAAILHQPVARPAHPADWEIYQLPPPVSWSVGLILGLPDCAGLILGHAGLRLYPAGLCWTESIPCGLCRLILCPSGLCRTDCISSLSPSLFPPPPAPPPPCCRRCCREVDYGQEASQSVSVCLPFAPPSPLLAFVFASPAFHCPGTAPSSPSTPLPLACALLWLCLPARRNPSQPPPPSVPAQSRRHVVAPCVSVCGWWRLFPCLYSGICLCVRARVAVAAAVAGGGRQERGRNGDRDSDRDSDRE